MKSKASALCAGVDLGLGYVKLCERGGGVGARVCGIVVFETSG